MVVFLAFQQPRAGIAGFLLAGTLAVVTFAAILLTPYIVLRRRAEASLRRDGTRVPARVEGRAATTRPVGVTPTGESAQWDAWQVQYRFRVLDRHFFGASRR